jgi:hypothetical protein
VISSAEHAQVATQTTCAPPQPPSVAVDRWCRSCIRQRRRSSWEPAGTGCSRLAWCSATSNTGTTTNTSTRPRATDRRPSRLRRAGTPTPWWPARSRIWNKTPDFKTGWTQNRGLATPTCATFRAIALSLSHRNCDRHPAQPATTERSPYRSRPRGSTKQAVDCPGPSS